jgi:hypothetical protein
MVIATRSTSIGAFASRVEADKAVGGLLDGGFGPDQIGVVLPEDVDAQPEESSPTALWAGSMFRSLIGVEIPDSEIRYYDEALQDGSTLVMVRAGDQYPEAMEILHRYGGKYMAAF